MSKKGNIKEKREEKISDIFELVDKLSFDSGQSLDVVDENIRIIFDLVKQIAEVVNDIQDRLDNFDEKIEIILKNFVL